MSEDGTFRIAMLQLNPIVGDLKGNADKIIKAIGQAGNDLDLMITPEMALIGYPPRDLLLSKAFIEDACGITEDLPKRLRGLLSKVLIGTIERNTSSGEGRPLYNAALLYNPLDPVCAPRYFRKSLLPTYDVFDEDRYFEPSLSLSYPRCFATADNIRIGVSICEDIWNDEGFWPERRYQLNPIRCMVDVNDRRLKATA